MLALCLMLSLTYYAQNYAGIIGWSLQSAAVNLSRDLSMNPAFIYKDIWSSTVGEHLICERKTLNSTDRYAVAVKDDVIIGHLPRVMSRIVSDL